MNQLTVDEALKILQKAKQELGGNACLILSLSSSGIQDVDVNNMVIINDKDNAYVEVQVLHEDLNACLAELDRRYHDAPGG
jgi:hypothetical protein